MTRGFLYSLQMIPSIQRRGWEKNNSEIHVVLFLKFQLVVAEIGTGAGIGTGRLVVFADAF